MALRYSISAGRQISPSLPKPESKYGTGTGAPHQYFEHAHWRQLDALSTSSCLLSGCTPVIASKCLW
jgi:hypothetical protein